jgi:hypothetical protein
VTPSEWALLTVTLATLAAGTYAGLRLGDALLRYRRDPDRAHRAFLAGRWWS